MNMKKRWRGLLAWILSATMILGMSGVPTFADGEENLQISAACPHHVHDENCGYAEGTPCNHVHTEDCYTAVTNCIHQHDESCGGLEDETACTHQCSEESGCITKELNCQHVHDESCGYTAGSPCTFDPADCELCNPKNEGTQEQCSCTTLCTEGEMNKDWTVRCAAQKMPTRAPARVRRRNVPVRSAAPRAAKTPTVLSVRRRARICPPARVRRPLCSVNVPAGTSA